MDDVRDMSENLESQVKEKAEQAKAAVSDAAGRARAKTEEYWEGALELIRDNPGKAIGVSFLVGLALGALVSGTSGDDEKHLQAARRAAESGEENWRDTKESLARSLEELRGFLDEAAGKLRA